MITMVSLIILIQQPFTGESEAYEGHVSMVDLLLAAGAAPDAGADVGGAKGFVGSVGLGGGGGSKMASWGSRCGKDRSSSNHFMGTGDNRGRVGMQWNRREYIIQYRFTSTFPMILYNQNISKWGYVDVFGI